MKPFLWLIQAILHRRVAPNRAALYRATRHFAPPFYGLGAVAERPEKLITLRSVSAGHSKVPSSCQGVPQNRDSTVHSAAPSMCVAWNTRRFMPARFDRLPTRFLREVTDRLLALDGVEAVYYDVTHKPPGTVEWE